MGKLTNKDWWLGRTDDQRQRRADAVEGMKQHGRDFAAATDDAKRKAQAVNAERGERAETIRQDRDDKLEQLREESAAEREALAQDREGRSLGGWGRRK